MDDLGGDASTTACSPRERQGPRQEHHLPYCGTEQGKITLDKPTPSRGRAQAHPQEVRERLERIPDEDLPPLGIDPNSCRPEWMVLTALAVPPVTVRPSITLESGDRSEDDLTHKLVDVLRINQRLRENRDAGAPQRSRGPLELLQYHVTTYFDNQTSGILRPGTAPAGRSRAGQRLKGTEGRFVSNLYGKRVKLSPVPSSPPTPRSRSTRVGAGGGGPRADRSGPRSSRHRGPEGHGQAAPTPPKEDGRYVPGGELRHPARTAAG
jgi:DNA-directed RNA polymerase subunit A'